jgi:hypothetical protein
MKNLLKALAQFQSECPAIKKNSDNPFFKSKYAALDAIQHHIQPYLTKYGLTVIQPNHWTDGQLFVKTIVHHVDSGEYIESAFPVVTQKHTAQDYGSAVTYAKRYSLTGALNIIVEDEDDDGNTATQGATQVSFKQTPVPASDDKPWLNKQNQHWPVIVEALKEGKTDIKRLRDKYKISKATEAELTA